ncbi:hypothetical protein CJP74_01025 [Psittacicella melopsittaci]|uniref:Lipoprotein n=1 Tax=Psittacicella melopsittaci TaxID=2028576 RepID=A0A3A1Y612_9GAMM|nr:hypothetical protein [Psittacicella melopsittaci]RIY33693.1 hypothetical protein CJP74_01025 [Psittacicella melopsittaci]
MRNLYKSYKHIWQIVCIGFLSVLLTSCAGGVAKSTAENLLNEQNYAVVHDYNNDRYYAVSSPDIYGYVEMRVSEQEQVKMQDIASGKYSNAELEKIVMGKDFYLVRNAAVLQLAANYYNNGQVEKAKEILGYFNYAISIRSQKGFFASLNNPIPIIR